MKTSKYSKIFRVLLSIGLSKEKIKKQDFSGAYFSEADFRGADFSGADFRGANMNFIISETTFGLNLNCPEIGSFIGYKKCKGLIVTLKITEDAKRSSATTYKCRCSKAEVLDIENGLTEIASDYDSEFIYKVGEIVEVSDFDENRWNECSTGIHFFMSKQMAKNYN